MLQYNGDISKGATMQNTFLLGMTKEVYDIIHETFPDKNQADGVASIMEKVLLQAEIINQADFQNKLDVIIFKVKEKLGEDFATKSDLKAALAELELKLMQEIGNIKTDIASLATSVESLKKGFDDKINSFKYSIIAWIAGSLIVGLGLVATINKLL